MEQWFEASTSGRDSPIALASRVRPLDEEMTAHYYSQLGHKNAAFVALQPIVKCLDKCKSWDEVTRL